MLSNDAFASVQHYLAKVIGEIARLGLDIVIETDFKAFAEFRRKVGDGLVYPSFDPKHSDLSERAFWIRGLDRHGRTVATHASKVFETESFYEEIRSERLWFDRRPRLVAETVAVSSPIPDFAGTVGHTGGMYVDVSQRGRGLSCLFPALARALMIRNHGIDHDTGVVSEAIYRSIIPTGLYRYTRVALCVASYDKFAGFPEPVYLCHITRDEALAAMAAAGPVFAAPAKAMPVPAE